MTDEAVAARLEETRTFHHELAETLARSLTSHGQVLEVRGHLLGDGRVTSRSPRGNGDDRLVTVGRLSRGAGALIRAVSTLSSDGNSVGISAILRQLLELEYLLWTATNDDAAAAAWLNSTRDERRKSWQPVHLRIRSEGHFRQEQYSIHCELGGHPTPEGLQLLLDPPDIVEALIPLDALDHGIAIWRSAQAFGRSEDSDEVEQLIARYPGGVARLLHVLGLGPVGGVSTRS